MHEWGDKEVDWKGIEDCCYILHTTCARWGRFSGQTKEKYGTVRFYAYLGNISLHSLLYPEYVYSQFKWHWLWKLDIDYISPFLNFCFGKIFYKWQSKVYNHAYQKCLKKYPHLRKEILCCADWSDLIKNSSY